MVEVLACEEKQENVQGLSRSDALYIGNKPCRSGADQLGGRLLIHVESPVTAC